MRKCPPCSTQPVLWLFRWDSHFASVSGLRFTLSQSRRFRLIRFTLGVCLFVYLFFKEHEQGRGVEEEEEEEEETEREKRENLK